MSDRRRATLTLVSLMATFVVVRCAMWLSPDSDFNIAGHNVHHLYTPVTARLRAGHDLLDLVARLHPTPAVGGLPRDTALAWLREHEGLDRGWYAAPVGWMGADGDGEFAVALRSALLDGESATLFAGCGVVGDSDPDDELAESELKLRPMLQALDGETTAGEVGVTPTSPSSSGPRFR